ncbi:hypothetical protein SCHPADRAFT_204449 [Schizopora paradoxa]|uniref:Uncharacterized protein n=1 Tax=Schizopora paradoxa TaxID=27342 RepID=A0A0H2RXR9_9AGAM|nr:hypothetical protein SCHPADRAFT_204449 [Schizopora paradoxa]
MLLSASAFRPSKCPYCAKSLKNDSAVRRHIPHRPQCQAAHIRKLNEPLNQMGSPRRRVRERNEQDSRKKQRKTFSVTKLVKDVLSDDMATDVGVEIVAHDGSKRTRVDLQPKPPRREPPPGGGSLMVVDNATRMEEEESLAGSCELSVEKSLTTRDAGEWHGSDDEEGLAECISQLKIDAEYLREAAQIIEDQLPFRNRLWIRSMVKLGIGKAASSLVSDVRWAEKTGKTRARTWAENNQELRRSKNLMGYQFDVANQGSLSRSLPTSPM